MSNPVKSGASARFETASIDSPRWAARAAAPLGKLWARVLRAHEIRRMKAELKALDDRALKDIGLSRFEIDLVARHGRHWG